MYLNLNLQNQNTSSTTEVGKRQIKGRLRSLKLFQREKIRGLCNVTSLLHLRDFLANRDKCLLRAMQYSYKPVAVNEIFEQCRFRNTIQDRFCFDLKFICLWIERINDRIFFHSFASEKVVWKWMWLEENWQNMQDFLSIICPVWLALAHSP